jgi:hypothetical protein
MWIKQKVKNRAGEYEMRPVWWEPKKEEVKELPVTYSIASVVPTVPITYAIKGIDPGIEMLAITATYTPTVVTATYTPTVKTKKGKKE